MSRNYSTQTDILNSLITAFLIALIIGGLFLFFGCAARQRATHPLPLLWLHSAPHGPQVCATSSLNGSPYRRITIFAILTNPPSGGGDWTLHLSINSNAAHFTFPPTPSPSWSADYPAGIGRHAIEATLFQEGAKRFKATHSFTVYGCGVER